MYKSLFKAETAEEMRAEVVRYLEFIVDKHTQNSRMLAGKTQKTRELNIAAVVTALSTDFKFAQIIKP